MVKYKKIKVSAPPPDFTTWAGVDMTGDIIDKIWFVADWCCDTYDHNDFTWYERTFYFRRESDAMHFRLKWI